jgi:REP element-mobilizing transposase RayT
MTLPPKYAVSDIVKHIKGYSSRVVEGLQWQNGYSAFTVDESSFSRVFFYIKMQQKDHKYAALGGDEASS